MTAARRVWEDTWFRPGAPLGLCAVRTIVAAQALWIILSRPDLPDAAGLPEALQTPLDASLGVRFAIGGLPLSVEWVLFLLLHAALALAIAGVRSRWACAVSGLLLYHFAPFEELITAMPHTFFGGLTLPLLALLVLSFAETPRWRGAPAPEFRWPLSLVRLFLALSYFFAAWAKIYYSGPGWFSADNIRGIMIMHWSFVPRGPALWVANNPAVCWAATAATFLLEFLFPLAVLSPRAAWLFAAAALAFHAGIALTTSILFLSLPCLLLLVDFDWIHARLAARGFKES